MARTSRRNRNSSLLPSRRRFLTTSAAALSAPLILPNLSRAAQVNDKLNVAVIGAGGRGVENLAGLVNTNSVNVVALCDCDARNAAASFKRFPAARHHSDWRKMLDQQKDIDAVLVSTPDHNHAVISIAAMRLGKHVYCEKPLARSIFETRRMAEVASETNRVTQMGTQGHAYEGTRRAVEVIRAGLIGDVKELHVWTDRPANWWPQGVRRPEDKRPIPDGLDWDLWLGPAPHRPYHPDYVPFKWRGRWDFGTGAIGDMGIHNLDTAFWALELGLPTSAVVRHCSPVLNDPAMLESAPAWSIIELNFPARGDKPPVKMTWYDGNKLPPKDLFQGEPLITKDGGSLVIGSKGTLFTRTWHGGDNDKNMFVLLPRKEFLDFKPPEQAIPRTPSHHHEWIAACKGQGKTLSNFAYAATLTESLLLGNLALRAGGKVEWDAANMKARGNDGAGAFVKPELRTGWLI